ncbi:cell division protein FtsQ/DivIB [Risungbinella massiliensis]|uniref:cell division protein FtsQ/DivIB n=1 Tax=Risungbinella massiliensis TaxID=1329796 RepID=UPI0005CC282E|nr:FtsQ-type POTRA domain-containing protein [Risungbinella massiliensis]
MEERVPPFRTRMMGKSSTSPWAKVLVFLFFVGLVSLLFLRSPYSKISEIQVTGTHLLTTQDVLTRMKTKVGDSYFRVSEREIQKGVLTLPEVKEVHVTKSFPAKLEVNVTEHAIIAHYRTLDNRLYPILASGVILLQRPIVETTASLVTLEGFPPNSPLLNQAVREFSLLPAAKRELFWKMEPQPGRSDQLILLTKNHHKIIARVDDFHQKIQYYEPFQKEPPGTIYLLESVWFSPDS